MGFLLTYGTIRSPNSGFTVHRLLIAALDVYIVLPMLHEDVRQVNVAYEGTFEVEIF